MAPSKVDCFSTKVVGYGPIFDGSVHNFLCRVNGLSDEGEGGVVS